MDLMQEIEGDFKLALLKSKGLSGGVNSMIFSLLHHLVDLSGLYGFFASQT